MVQDVVQEGNVFVINASNDCTVEAKNNQLFFRKLQITHKGDPYFKFYWADTDLMTPSSWRGGKNNIIQYEGGQEISGNVYKDFKEGRLRIIDNYDVCSKFYFQGIHHA